MKPRNYLAILIALPVLILAGTAFAAVVADPGSDPGGFAAALLDAAKSGQWRLLSGLALVAVVWTVRQYGSKYVPWFKTDRGGAALVLVLSLLGGVATTLASDAPFAWSLLLNSLVMAFQAAGSWAIVKKILAPSDKKVDTGIIVMSPDSK